MTSLCCWVYKLIYPLLIITCDKYHLSEFPIFLQFYQEMGHNCLVYRCNTSSRNKGTKHFFRIPSKFRKNKDLEIEKLSKVRHVKWLTAIKRVNLSDFMKKEGRVCSDHFLTG